MSILGNIARKVGLKGDQSLVGLTNRQLIDKEAQIGRQLFGPVPKGRRREFFCLDRNTWIWYEEWTDHNGQRQHVNTRYEITPNGVLKVQGDKHYVFVGEEEAVNLYRAMKLYYQYTSAHIYNVHPQAV